MTTRRPIALAIGLAAALGLLGPAGISPAADAAAKPSAPTFGRPAISGIQGNGFEQGGRLDTHGRIYTTAPASLSSTISFLWRSLDGGQTFKWVPGAAPLLGKLPTCVGGGDSEVAADSSDHVYLNELTLANFTASRSEDQGATFVTSCVAVSTTPDDREWYAADGDPTNGGSLYLTYDEVAGGTVQCPTQNGSTSVANNQLVVARSPAALSGASAGVIFAPSKAVGGGCDEGIMGNIEVSPVTHHVFVIHDNAILDQIRIGRCSAVSFLTDPSGLSCVDLPVATFPAGKTGANFPSLAIDRAGNLYAAWAQAPVDSAGNVTGDTLLYWSSSTNEGNTWTAPVLIPTPGLHNNVFTWMAAGDRGRVDLAWYGAAAPMDPGTTLGPDSTSGPWGLYFTQTLNGTNAAPTFTTPILASEHDIHRGSMFTLIGGQNGSRALGDFLNLRIGLQGEAVISYSDSNNQDLLAKAMVVRQNGGSGVYAGVAVSGSAAAVNSVTDPAGDATFDADGNTSANQPNLDILASSVSMPDPQHYRITMKVADLTSLAPAPATGNTDTDLVWLTQWLAPSSTDPNGGKNFFVYMESTNGGAPTFWAGESAEVQGGGGLFFSYPGATQVAGSYKPGAPGTITITVPLSAVTVAGAIDRKLYSVTASTMTLPVPANSVPVVIGVGGSLFNLIDVAQPYDFVPPR
jgi:hypothetical protein